MIYTLAQTGTKPTQLGTKAPIIIRGNGSDLSNEKMQKARCKKKIITQTLVQSLIKVAEKKRDTKLVKSLWNTYYCQNRIHTSAGLAYSDYCKNRFCTVCLGIRKAEIIRKYLPVLMTWENPHFVTLTAKAVSAKSLERRFSQMNKGLNIIIARYRKRNHRGKGKKLIGIKSLESNFNPRTRTYNPHIHLIVPDKETAEIIITEWLHLLTAKFAIRKAQDIRPVYDLEKGLIEIIKYGTKVFTTPDGKRNQKNRVQLYAKAFYNIITAMKGHRLFDRFGFNLPVNKNTLRKEEKTVDYEDWIYAPNSLDWENTETGIRLAKYLPSDKLINLLANGIDVELE